MEASQPALTLSSANSAEISPIAGGTLPTANPTATPARIAAETTPHRVRATAPPAALSCRPASVLYRGRQGPQAESAWVSS